jgi:glycosyltransferase involved in cell wall biosynthesis
VIRNAVNPAFNHLFDDDENILSTKQQPPIIIYAGSTPRGVIYLPAIITQLATHRRDFTLEVFSACAPTGSEEQDKTFRAQIAALPNITHVGTVGQKDLAAHMKHAAILFAPNPWPETSCITLLEALVAGMRVIATNRAALPETAMGFAKLITVPDADHPTRFDMEMPIPAFVNALDTALTSCITPSAEKAEELVRQRQSILSQYQWPLRAAEWLEYLRHIVGG